jgi:hypothetical protein
MNGKDMYSEPQQEKEYLQHFSAHLFTVFFQEKLMNLSIISLVKKLKKILCRNILQ